MSGMTADQLHRSTLEIYSTLMDEFNPNLQKLASLGNSYIQAFQALAARSEAYFSALSKIGEKAFHTMSSRSLGDVLIQISETQRRLTLELEGVFRWFAVEVIRELDTNIRLDKDYISNSRKRYEVEVHNQAAVLERQMWRGVNQDRAEYLQFLRKSQAEALEEENRRHRFLAEKHCSLIQSIAQIMNKSGGSLQQRVDAWTKEAKATRGQEARQSPSVDNSVGMKQENDRKSREEVTLGNIPSRAPSPLGGVARSSPETLEGRAMRARVAHQPSSSKPNLLAFSKGEMVTVLVKQPKNGWLYGRAESSSQPGWFPASYVEAVDDPPSASSSWSSMGSISSLPDQPWSRSQIVAQPPPPPPPPPTPNSFSNRQPDMHQVAPSLGSESNSENKKSKPHGSRPELFPRGTNPFATVKLKPTATDDRSAPRFRR